MPSIINTNISSLTAQRQLSVSQTSLATAMARLSSGLRVNSAKDDAAGLAISERFTSQIRGSNQAARNANDGISLAQTAEGDLAQISNNLQRIRELAVQAANGTNSSSDRVSLNNEAAALVVENDRLATTSAFNGIKLLDGTFTAQIFQVGANGSASDVVAVSSIASARANSLGVGASSSYASTVAGASPTLPNNIAAGTLAVNNQAIGATASDGVSSSFPKTSGIAIAAAINAISGATNVTATVSATTSAGVTVAIAGATTALLAGAVTINGVDVGAIAASTSIVGRGTQVAAAINAKTSQTGVTAAVDTATGAVALTAADGRNIVVGGSTGVGTSTGLGNGGVIVGAATSATVPTAAGITVALVSGDVLINGVDIGPIGVSGSALARGTAVAAAINAISDRTNVTAAVGAGGLVSLSGAVSATTITGTGAGLAVNTGLQVNAGTNLTLTSTSSLTRSAITLNSASSDGITLAGLSSTALSAAGLTEGYTTATTTAGAGVSSINLTTAAGAQAALAAVDSAINTVNSTRAALGAYQARFVSVVASLATTAENLTASRSRVQDADFAAETAALSRAQILQQAGTAMVAQANQLPQGVMALLRQ
jgi:flagellin